MPKDLHMMHLLPILREVSRELFRQMALSGKAGFARPLLVPFNATCLLAVLWKQISRNKLLL